MELSWTISCCSDGTIVVHHDERIRRTAASENDVYPHDRDKRTEYQTTRDTEFRFLTWPQVQGWDVGSWFHRDLGPSCTMWCEVGAYWLSREER